MSTVFHWQFLKVYIPKGVNLSTWKYEGHSTSQVSPWNYHFICILYQFSFWTNLLKHWYLASYWKSNKRFTLKDKDSNKIPCSKSFAHFNPKYSPALQTWILESANLESNSQTRAKKGNMRCEDEFLQQFFKKLNVLLQEKEICSQLICFSLDASMANHISLLSSPFVHEMWSLQTFAQMRHSFLIWQLQLYEELCVHHKGATKVGILNFTPTPSFT